MQKLLRSVRKPKLTQTTGNSEIWKIYFGQLKTFAFKAYELFIVQHSKLTIIM